MLIALAALALHQPQAQVPTRAPILIRDVTVIEPSATQVSRQRMDIRIVGERIQAIASTGSLTGTERDSVIDGRGLFAIPGLIDAHVHVSAGNWEQKAAMLKGALNGGITSVYDVAGEARATMDLQRAVTVGEIPGPRISYVAFMAGPAYFANSGNRNPSAGRDYPPGGAPWSQAITDTTDLVRAVTLAKGTGATALKVYAALDSALATRIVREAKRQGLQVFAHATVFPGRPSDLVNAGVDILMHAPYLVWDGSPRSMDFAARPRGDFLGVPAGGPAMDKLLRLMKEKGTALNSTFFVFSGGGGRGGDSLPSVRTPWMYAVTKRASELGVRLVAGTDGLFNARADSMPGLHRELEMLVNGAKLSPIEALRSATTNGAWAINNAETGTLAPGKLADIVLLGADPLADINNTRSVRVVVQGGRVVRR